MFRFDEDIVCFARPAFKTFLQNGLQGLGRVSIFRGKQDGDWLAARSMLIS